MASIQSNSNSEQGHPANESTAARTAPQFNSFWDYIVYALATGFGVGWIPFAPGTFGSILGVVLWFVLMAIVAPQISTSAHASTQGAIECTQLNPTELSILVGTILGLILISVPICGRAGRMIGKRDPGCVVLDEIVAIPFMYLMCLIWGLEPAIVTVTDYSVWYAYDLTIQLRYIVMGLILFRIFDIAKPWPIRHVERFKGGWGIVADDLVAAIYASVCLSGIVYLSERFQTTGHV